MFGNKTYQVFISSTYKDLIEERSEAINKILDLNCFPVGMENFPATDDETWSAIKKLIEACDYYIVIVAGRYGSIASDGMSFTEREYRYALKMNIPILAFIHSDISTLPYNKVEKSGKKIDKLNNFISLLESRITKGWSNKSELGGYIITSLIRLIKDNPRTGWIRADEKTKAYYDLSEKLNIIQEENHNLVNENHRLSEVSLNSPTIYSDFVHTLPKIEEVLKAIHNEEFTKTLKIRMLGICFNKSFEHIKTCVEAFADSGKRIEIRLSKLEHNSDTWKILDVRWENYYQTYIIQRDALVEKLRTIEGANVSIKLSKYSHMPNWHGIMINKSHLFLGRCFWNTEKTMTGGENPYHYYRRGNSKFHDQQIQQFKRWFDYTRYNGTVAKEDQLLIDTKNRE